MSFAFSLTRKKRQKKKKRNNSSDDDEKSALVFFSEKKTRLRTIFPKFAAIANNSSIFTTQK